MEAPCITVASPPSGSWIHQSPEVGPGKARFTVKCVRTMLPELPERLSAVDGTERGATLVRPAWRNHAMPAGRPS